MHTSEVVRYGQTYILFEKDIRYETYRKPGFYESIVTHIPSGCKAIGTGKSERLARQDGEHKLSIMLLNKEICDGQL